MKHSTLSNESAWPGAPVGTEDHPLVYDLDEAALLLKISLTSMYASVRNGEIPSVRIGRRLLIPRRALYRLLDGDDAA